MDRIITIPQSATLTAPFHPKGYETQGSLGKVASKPYVSQYEYVKCCRNDKNFTLSISNCKNRLVLCKMSPKYINSKA